MMNVSWFLLLICVLNSIVPSVLTLISVWPLAVDVVGGVSFFAVSFACRTHIVPLPFFAGAALTAVAAATHAMTKEMIKRRICPHSLRSGCLRGPPPRQRFSNRANGYLSTRPSCGGAYF